VIVAIDVQLALAALSVIPLLAVYAVLVRPRIKAAQREARDRYGAVASRATESLRHVRAAQAFGRGADEQLRFGTDSASAADAAIGALALSARLTPLADVVIAIGSSVIMVLGVQGVLSGRITLGVLLVVLTYLGDVYGPIRSLVGLTISFASAAASRERLIEILGADEVVHDDPHPKALPSGPIGLKLSSVRFAYRSGEPVLKDVDLTVDPGETLCVIGPTGTGKSTLLALLVRLYDPDAGTIEAGGVDLRKLRLSSLRASVAFVPQDAWIFDGTIRDNIAFGRPDATAAELQDAARIALADEFIDRFPDGMDTIVGEDGARLSGGQRRRLALARALVRRSEILLLDEPTSGLDAASESVVLEAIRSAARGRATVIVTHRLNVAGIADRVVILAGGTVTDQGSPSIRSEVRAHPPGRDRVDRQQDLGRGQPLDARGAQDRPSGRAAVGRNALGHTQTTADDGNDRERGGEFRDDPRNGQRVPAPSPPHDEGLDPAPEGGHAAVAPHP
jgi:ATP-binding cassette, subfamily B, bacterial